MGNDVRKRLTKRSVDATAPQGTRFTVMDDELAGFGLRVEPSGVKTYFIRYRANGGGRRAPQRQMIIGRHGMFTPDEARRTARQLLGSVAKGDDPAGARTAARREITITELVDLYEREGCYIQRGARQGVPMKPRTKAYTLARLRNHVIPLLGNRRASDINPGDIERFVADVRDGKTARDQRISQPEATKTIRLIVKGGDGAARKAVRDFSAMFSFAKRRGIVPANPVELAAVRRTDGRRDRFLSVEEIGRLGKALDKLQTEGMNAKVANIVRLLMLTGCRRDEIAGLKWSEVDFDGAVLRLEGTKTGRSVRPLGAAARTVLITLHSIRTSEFVFPSERGDGFYVGTIRYWPKIIKQAKLSRDVTLHVLRHTVGAIAASSGESMLLIGAMLGHANTRSTAGYAHLARHPTIAAADRVFSSIGEALAGSPTADTAGQDT